MSTNLIALFLDIALGLCIAYTILSALRWIVLALIGLKATAERYRRGYPTVSAPVPNVRLIERAGLARSPWDWAGESDGDAA